MVLVFKSKSELVAQRDSEKEAFGFVPTMGNLHAGHISLLEEALKHHNTVYFSIFVNPKQFGPTEDFTKYPRTFEQDLALIEKCANNHPQKKVVVFSPTDPKEVFPEPDSQNISVLGLKDMLEGEFRPTHFDGVATVVYRLFELVKPQTAYFGLKDYQQYLVIKQMVKDLALPINIIGMPIIREATGLALSSRNQYLSPDEKIKGLLLSQSLLKLKEIIQGKRSNLKKAEECISVITEDPKWNYLEIRDGETLSHDLSRARTLSILGVYQLGSTRLLDNIQLEIQ